MPQKQFHGDRHHAHGRCAHALQMKREGWVLRQIGVVLGVSRERARQILWKGARLEAERANRLNFWEIARKQRRANAAIMEGLTKLRITPGGSE